MNLFEGCDGKNLRGGLRWLNEPPQWGFSRGKLEIVPVGVTDFFRPAVGQANDNSCLLYTLVSGDFTAVTAASAHLVGFGDAAALTVRASAERWAKICIERSPAGEVAIVSVVTDRYSDDANNELLPSAEGMLRITRLGNLFGFHHSRDGARWRFVRAFHLDLPIEAMVGVHAQAPFGAGCTASFNSFAITPGAVKDFRSGE
jgi:regulation of enolase protein 1 (concanavalin A-like superfamily)